MENLQDAAKAVVLEAYVQKKQKMNEPSVQLKKLKKKRQNELKVEKGSNLTITQAQSRKECILFIYLLIVFLVWHPRPVDVPSLGLHWSCSCQPTPQPQQHGIKATSVTYTTAHSITGSLTD